MLINIYCTDDVMKPLYSAIESNKYKSNNRVLYYLDITPPLYTMLYCSSALVVFFITKKITLSLFSKIKKKTTQDVKPENFDALVLG